MIAMTRRSWLAAVGLAPLAATAAENPKSQQRTFQNIPPRELLRLRHFPNSELVTHQGKKVRFYDDLIKGRKVVINFMYAKCEGICVPVTANLVKVQKILKGRVGRDIFMYSITLKPEEDTPEVLNKWARAGCSSLESRATSRCCVESSDSSMRIQSKMLTSRTISGCYDSGTSCLRDGQRVLGRRTPIGLPSRSYRKWMARRGRRRNRRHGM